MKIDNYECVLKVNKYDIDYINKIVEAYEGLGVIRTLDSKNGIIKIITNVFFENDIKLLFEKLEKFDIKITILEEKRGAYDGIL